MPFAVTAIYAGLLALIAITLGTRVGIRRGKLGVSLGDAGDPALTLNNRRHLNWIEHVPIAIILIGIIEANGAPKLMIHVLGGLLVLARIIHPVGLNAESMAHPLRFLGAMTTMLVTLVAAVFAIWQGISVL
jgi:uncharacterized membrane protein YecN with MAPEG domain